LRSGGMDRIPLSIIPQLRLLISELEGPENPDETVSEAFTRFLAQHGSRLKPSTQAQYADALGAFARRHGKVAIGNLTPGHVDTFLRDCVATGSVSSVYSALSSAFSWLRLRGLLLSARPKSVRRTAYLDVEQSEGRRVGRE